MASVGLAGSSPPPFTSHRVATAISTASLVCNSTTQILSRRRWSPCRIRRKRSCFLRMADDAAVVDVFLRALISHSEDHTRPGNNDRTTASAVCPSPRSHGLFRTGEEGLSIHQPVKIRITPRTPARCAPVTRKNLSAFQMASGAEQETCRCSSSTAAGDVGSERGFQPRFQRTARHRAITASVAPGTTSRRI